MIFLNTCKSELSYILPDIFLKESCFPSCWKVLFVVPVFKKVEEGFRTKIYCTTGFLTMVSKIFKKILSNRFVDSIKKCDFFYC